MLDAVQSAGYYITGGHFRLVSGKHSDAYIQARLALMDPTIGDVLIQGAVKALSGAKPKSIAAFTVGGLLLADSLSKQLGLPLIKGRKKGGKIEWLNGDAIAPKARTVLVDDVLTTPSQVNLAISSLEETKLESIAGVLVAIDRSPETPALLFRETSIPLYSCIRIPLPVYDPSACPLCRIGIPPVDLSSPEEDFISVLLSQPSDKSDFILSGYERAYRMQDEKQLVADIDAWKPWLPILIAGLPMSRMQEDSRLVRFVTHLTSIAKEYGIEARVLSELIGQLISMSAIRIESRSVGCSILIGDPAKIGGFLESKAKVNIPPGVSSEDLSRFIPYLDAFLETHYAIMLDKKGTVIDVRRLVYNRPDTHKQGTEFLRFVTASTAALGIVLRRGRSAISVYSKGRLEAIAELSEKTGLWEFSRPRERVDEIEKLLPILSEFIAIAIEAGRELVANGHGGLFVIGDSTDLSHKLPKVDLEPRSLKEMSIEDIVELAKIDGAVLINEKGELTAATVIIKNKETGTEATPESSSAHGGARKEAARRTSLECPNCVAIYVSQNGSVEIYVRGDSYPITEAIPGLARG